MPGNYTTTHPKHLEELFVLYVVELLHSDNHVCSLDGVITKYTA